MNRIFVVLLLIVALVNPGCAGFGKLKQDWEKYTPDAPFSLPVSGQPAPMDKSAAETDFKDQTAAIRKLQKRLEQDIRTGSDDTGFVKISDALETALSPAATDEVFAARVLADGFGLEKLEALILYRNPGIKAAQNQTQARIAQLGQVGELDEILRAYSAFTETVMPGVGPMKGTDDVSMKFPFPGTLALKGQVVEQDVMAARASLAAILQDTVTQGRKAFWDLVYLHGAWRITHETVDLFRQLESAAKIRYDTGKTSYQDVVRVTIQKELLEENLVTLERRRKSLEVRILALADLASNTPVGVPRSKPEFLPGDKPQALYELAVANNPDLAGLRAKIGKMQRMILMAETMIMPPYSQNLSLFKDQAAIQVGSGAMKPAFATESPGSRAGDLPLKPFFGADNAYILEMRRQLAAMQNDLQKAQTELEARVQRAWTDLDQAVREAARYEKHILKLAHSALEVATRGYESGTVMFADVMASYKTWLEAGLTLKRKQSDIGVNQAELARIIGTSM